MIQSIRNKFYETPKELLDASVEKQNEIRNNTDDVLITAENLWLPETYSVAQAASLLRDASIMTRESGRELDKNGLMARCKIAYEGNPPKEWYVPSAFGYNWIGYWKPIVSDFIFTTAMVLLIFFMSHIFYLVCEFYHDKWGCNYLWNSMRPECYLLKQARFKIEGIKYYIAYTSVVSLGVAFTGILTKTQLYAKSLIG
tara:strand:- start:61 stop:657 length:597 start_codon:yes stop_codon:yes gene_type:complete